MKIDLPKSPERILLIKPSAVGDVVQTLPILNLLRKRWPMAKITWLLTPLCSGLLNGHPQLDEVILFDRHHYGRSWRSPAVLGDLIQMTRELRQREFDLVIDLQGLFRSGWLTYQTRAPVRIGFANGREFSWLGYTHRVPVATMEQHAIERYLSVTEALGCGRGPVEFVFATDDADRRAAADLIGGIDRYALLFPGTNWPTKRWPVENFAALIDPLEQRFGIKCIVAGSSAERELADQVRGAINVTGRTTLRQLTALIERAALVITNDTGPMHIAAALNRPMVALFGPTNPIRTGPYRHAESVLRLDIPCSPCYSRTCSHQSCLQWLKVDQVIRAVERPIEPLPM